MRILVTGSAGHLGEALLRVIADGPDSGVGLDVLPSPWTDVVASVTDHDAVAQAVQGVDAVIHTATLHKPHVETHPRSAFVDVNVHGTLAVLEAAAAARVGSVVLTSTTSAFGLALSPAAGRPAAWIDESVVPVPKNVYGATKVAAEDMAQLVHRDTGLPVVVLRTSRFFPEADDDPGRRAAMPDDALKAVEHLNRRVALEDVVDAHLRAVAAAPAIGFGRFVVSAQTPLRREDVGLVRTDLPGVLDRRVPTWRTAFAELGWPAPAGIDRIYDSGRAQEVLGWRPRWDFAAVVDRALAGGGVRTPLSHLVGAKGYHRAGGPFRAGR